MEQIYDSRHSGQEVDNAVDAVQTTIPNQLTQIGSKLDDLDSNLDDLDSVINGIEINYTEGKYINAQGELVDNTSFVVSDFIPINPDNDIVWTWGSTPANITIYTVLFDANKTPYPSGYWYSQFHKTSVIIGANSIQSFAPNAAFARVSFKLLELSAASVVQGSMTWTPRQGSEGLADRVATIEEKMSNEFISNELYLNGKVELANKIPLKRGYIENDGTLTAYLTWYYAVVFLESGRTITVDNTGIGAYPSLGIAANGNVSIGDVLTVVSGKTYTAVEDTWIVVSAGTELKSLVISTDKTYNNILELKREAGIPYEEVVTLRGSGASESIYLETSAEAGSHLTITLVDDENIIKDQSDYLPLYHGASSKYEQLYINRPVKISVSEDTSFRLYYNPKWLNKGGNIKFIISDYGKDFEITACPTIFARYYGPSTAQPADTTQRYTNKVYAEGFVEAYDDVMTIDGGRELPVRTYYDGTTSNLEVNIYKGSASRSITIPVKSVEASVAQNKKAFVLCIGESTTSATVRNPYKNKTEVCYGWPSSMQHFADIDNHKIGNINFKTLGTKHWRWEQSSENRYEYEGQLYTQRSFNEGWGGWTIFNMMYWAAHFINLNPSSSNPSNTTEMLWNLLGLATKTPYNQASYNEQREEFTNSAEQITLITQTPFLKYKIDGTSAVYEAIKTFAASTDYDYPAFERTDEYSGTQEQIDAMNAWGLELANNPVNPFYSLEKVRGGSDVAFSLEKYIERYRTMDDEGNRLSGNAGDTVTGLDGKTYTIGTRVTDVNAYDVCSPTHIIFNMGINESVNNTVANAVAAIKIAMAQFTLPTAYFFTRIPGVCNPAMWPDVITRKMSNSIINFHHQVMNEIIDWFDTQSNKYLLPVYHIQNPASVLFNFVEGCFNGDDGTEVLNASNNNVHPGYDAYRSIGWQCLNWVYYTLSLT